MPISSSSSPDLYAGMNKQQRAAAWLALPRTERDSVILAEIAMSPEDVSKRAEHARDYLVARNLLIGIDLIEVPEQVPPAA